MPLTMPDPTLDKFSRQIADWIAQRLRSERTPFQKLETGLPLQTVHGAMTADLVLWVNRPSQIAGSLILFPHHGTPDVRLAGAAMARALGLGHFVVWEARQIRIWPVDATADALQTLEVPSAREVEPHDFYRLIDRLLAELKLLTVTLAVAPGALSAEYFLNLCHNTVVDIQPDLLEQCRQAAGTARSDTWIEQVPTELAWLSLWRLLVLVTLDRLPPASGAESFEKAMLYALACLHTVDLDRFLTKGDNEPPLGQATAVRLHHLACRLQQLGWPAEGEQAIDLVCRLLDLAAVDLGLTVVAAPWSQPCPIAINVWPGSGSPPPQHLLAPRAFLAGLAVMQTLDEQAPHSELHQTLQELATAGAVTPLVAALTGSAPPERRQRDSLKVALRRFWPNRRFALPRQTPGYLWDTLMIAGLQQPAAELCLLLPHDWHLAPGATTVWQALTARYRVIALAEQAGPTQIMQLYSLTSAPRPVTVYRPSGCREIAEELILDSPPAILHVCLHASDDRLAALARGEKIAEELANGVEPAVVPGEGEAERAPLRRPGTDLEEIVAVVFRDGTPRFPHDYLRDFYRPALRSYSLTAPLVITDRFFDRILLSGPDAPPVEVDSAIKADILCLASYSTTGEVTIPLDDTIGAALLAAYRRDLQRLWQELQQECRRRQQRQQAARNLASRIWRQHNLPPARFFQD
ncbi:MAG: hypothetical protein RQ723_11195 [Desulfuromonadales bacterium]|nr:hypothetical protein [Desulfuromonadales bacterium]